MFNLFSVTITVAGSLTADTDFFFRVPCACTLRAVSAVADNATTANFNVGTSADADGFLDDEDVGQSNTPTMFDLDDFDGALISNLGDEYPHLDKNTIVHVNIDVDGSTDPDDLCIVLWFQEG